MTTIVRTIYQQPSRVIDADRPKFSNRQPPDQAAMPSGHLAMMSVQRPPLRELRTGDCEGNGPAASLILKLSGRKAIGRVLHYARQTYYRRIRRDSACNTFQEPIITSVIDVKKITAWGESGFPARFLVCKCADAQETSVSAWWHQGTTGYQTNRPGKLRPSGTFCRRP